MEKTHLERKTNSPNACTKLPERNIFLLFKSGNFFSVKLSMNKIKICPYDDERVIPEDFLDIKQ